MNAVEHHLQRIVDDETLVGLLEDCLQLHPMPVDLIILIVEVDDLAGHKQDEALRTFAGASRTSCGVQ